MPSSLIFAALAGAWLVVLVPMFAKRRQEVARTAESALASRVLRRPDPPRAAPNHGLEVHMIGGRILEREPWEPAVDGRDERRYRSGRGGYDPEAAAHLAQARYVFRQRVVLGLVVGAVVAAVLAYLVSSLWWWAHGSLDMALVGYLGYLRRQVQIEEDVRRRRAARLAGPRDRASVAGGSPEGPVNVAHDARDEDEPVQESPARSAAVSPVPHPTAVALDYDDEDPAFDELGSAFEPPYRRAVGE